MRQVFKAHIFVSAVVNTMDNITSFVVVLSILILHYNVLYYCMCNVKLLLKTQVSEKFLHSEVNLIILYITSFFILEISGMCRRVYVFCRKYRILPDSKPKGCADAIGSIH